MKFVYGFLSLFFFVSCLHEKELKPICSGDIWPDDKGVHINAHGGGILYHKGTFYWYGENKSDSTSNAMVGIMCYSSKNLTDWKNEGAVLPVVSDESCEIVQGCIMERPKVIYNSKTKKFVMWFHLELKGQGYAAARSAVAVSDLPTGPFKYLRSYQKWWTPEWNEAVKNGLFVKRDMQNGQMARDMQLFVDDDGKAYHIYSSEENLTLHIAELNDEYTGHTGKYVRVAPAGHNEAPAIFKADSTYWMISSGCTGWDPNEARMFSATNIFGPWTQHRNPCVGSKSEITFGGQSTFVLKLPGKKNAFIFMADIWKPKHPSDARYIWLPIQFKNGNPVVEWMDSWTLDFFDKRTAEK